MKDIEERSSKRRRLIGALHEEQKSINTVDQLHQLLHFSHTITPDAKAAINRFKDYLTAITRSEDLLDQSKSLKVLGQYCNDQNSSSEHANAFPDLISTWSLAVQSSNDPICSAVPAALAQFYKTISGVLDFRDFGLSLGRTLLKHENLRLFDRGISASRTKEHLISPCLRLLTEIVSFDGGALASYVFARRDVLFKRLDFLLDQPSADTDGDRRKPSVRRMSLRLLIANLKFLDADAKAEFIMHSRILRNCLRGLPTDGDDIVVDVLQSIEVGIVNEKSILRVTKSRIFGQESLATLLELYSYEPDSEHPESSSNVRNALHKLLIQLCTTKNGILVPQNGWYPLTFDNEIDPTSDDNHIDLGLDSLFLNNEYGKTIPVRNIILSIFAQSLKPESDALQSTLLLQILQSAPELVADYFRRKTKLISLSSEDPVWRSQFAFLFSVSQLPIPRNFGWPDDTQLNPPPIPVVVESILPRPLDRVTLSKHFTSDDEVLVLSAARLLAIALSKLQNVLDMFARRTVSSIWQQASMQLVEQALQRSSKLEEIINALQRTKKTHDAVRSALFECISTYHRVLPEATMGSKFDFGATLQEMLTRFNSQQTEAKAQTIELHEHVQHLAVTAQLSSATRWWNKPDTDTMSLFCQLLRYTVQYPEGATTKIITVLQSVVSFAEILSIDDLSFTALQLSIATTKKFEAASETWAMLDNALHRAVQRPVKYVDRVESLQQVLSDKKPLSLLAVAVAEQWEFVSKKYSDQKGILKNMAEWTVRLFTALDSVGENFRVIQQLHDDVLQVVDEKTRGILEKALEKGRKKPIAVDVTATATTRAFTSSDSAPKAVARALDLTAVLGGHDIHADSLVGVDRWDAATDVELAIQSGKVSKLLRCTASSVEEVRRQAFQSLQSLAHVVEQSPYEEKVQVHLVLGEVIETVQHHGFLVPLPSIAAELGVRLIKIVADPTHKMYGKANGFLLRSPQWDMKRLIPYWIRDILFQEPESDDAGAWTGEVEWLLQWLVDGLKTSSDLEMYRRRNVFEKILVLYTKPSLSKAIRRHILGLVWRGFCLDGADLLITRVGIQNWLRVARIHDREHEKIIQQLQAEVSDRCDAEAIRKWRRDLPVLREREV